MKQYSPKTHGITYLRHAVSHRNKKLNYISLPVEKAQEIIAESNGFQPTQNQYNSKSNSVRGAAVVLAMDLKELIERLNAPTPSKILNDLAEARNKIVALQDAGDILVHNRLNDASIKHWVRTKSL
jgi:hypothetical protein